MSFRGIIKFSDILKTASENNQIRNGCLVDTSILFAGSYDLDEFNTEAAGLFDYLAELKIPLYTNVNIRAEFIDLHRRAQIPEGLASLYSYEGKSLDPFLYSKLQVIATKFNEAKNNGNAYKFNEENIKEWRRRLKSFQVNNSDGWLKFCEDYLQGKIENIWDDTCSELNINFLSVRGSDKSDWLENELTWEAMASIVGRFGIGSFDAMIINLFLNSHFSAIITADKEIAYVIESLKPDGKFVIVPSRLNL